MATDRLNIISEEDKILAIVNDGKNFLLSGGAGSGKTYSLVQIIKTIITDKPQERIAVITYTNAATAEIKSRIDSPNLFISTIHEFLWDNIKSYQIQIKEALAALANKEAIANATAEEGKEKKQFAGFDAHGLIEKSIEYKEYKSLKDGIISHDEVLAIANYLFENYKKLRLIVKDKYQYIFLDEYQDTSPLVVEILLTFLQQDNSKKILSSGFLVMRCSPFMMAVLALLMIAIIIALKLTLITIEYKKLIRSKTDAIPV